MQNKTHSVETASKSSGSIKISRNVLILLIAVIIITLAVSYLIFSYYPKYQKDKEINSYKKSLFDSILCQYSCPLTPQQFQNKTQMLPEVECVKTCTQALREQQTEGAKFSNQELSKDDLVKDISSAVKECQTTGFSSNASVLDSSVFFPCVKDELTLLKDKYNYLN